MTQLDSDRAQLRAFGTDVIEESARSLDLLRTIDRTLAWLDRFVAHTEADTIFAGRLAADLVASPSEIDSDGTLGTILERAQQDLASVHEVLISKRASALGDPRLTDDDGIASGYDRAISAVADLHNELNSLRWSIMEHDTDVAPQRSGAFDSVEALIDDLRK